MSMKKITIDDIRSKLPEEKGATEKYNLWGHVLRPVSYYIAWLFLKLGISANKVTGISIIIGFVGCLFLAFGSYISMIIGALILNIWALLEYVDGDVARYNNSCSNYGAFVDDLNVAFTSVIFFISAGIGAFNHYPVLSLFVIPPFLSINVNGYTFLILGGLSASFYLFPSYVGAKFISLFSRDQNEIINETREHLVGNTLYEIVWLNVRNITGIMMPILLLAVIFGFLGLFVLLYALINICASVIVTVQILRKARSYHGSSK